MPRTLPVPAEEKALVQRLRVGDPTSSVDLADIYLKPLIRRLGKRNPTIDPALVEHAAVRGIATGFADGGLTTSKWGIGPETIRDELHHAWYQPFRHDVIGNTFSADLIDYLEEAAEWGGEFASGRA